METMSKAEQSRMILTEAMPDQGMTARDEVRSMSTNWNRVRDNYTVGFDDGSVLRFKNYNDESGSLRFNVSEATPLTESQMPKHASEAENARAMLEGASVENAMEAREQVERMSTNWDRMRDGYTAGFPDGSLLRFKAYNDDDGHLKFDVSKATGLTDSQKEMSFTPKDGMPNIPTGEPTTRPRRRRSSGMSGGDSGSAPNYTIRM